MKPGVSGFLPLALVLSVAAHGALLAVPFVDMPSVASRWRSTPPMEIVLVNAAAGEKPDKAVALAQKSLAGGGGADRGRATSPLPRAALSVEGDAAEDARRRAESMPTPPIPLPTAAVSQAPAAAPAVQPPLPQTPGEASDANAPEDRQRQLVDQLAEIERRLNRDNERPRKRYVSPATRESAYAGYVDALRRRIEAHGTRHFPELAGRKLYGELTLLVTVDADGRLLGADVVQGSGDAALDRRAQAIVRGIGGFGRFSEAMRRQADQIVLPSRFRFTRDQVLEARPNGQDRAERGDR